MKTVTGLFRDKDSALRAGEKVREVAGARATVRVLLPGEGQSVLETSVLTSSGGSARVAMMCVGLGVVGALAFKLLGLSWGMALVGLLYGVAGGAMLGVWLTGELYPTRLLSKQLARSRYEEVVRGGRCVVTACVADEPHASDVRSALRSAGGEVSDGFYHERLASERAIPAPAPAR